MVLCQSSAILRALGIRFGYYSTDPKVMWEIDSLLDFMEEGYPQAVGMGFKAMNNIEPTEEDMEKWELYFDKYVPFLAGRLEKHGQNYIAGTERLTIADLKVFQVFVLILEHPENGTPLEAK